MSKETTEFPEGSIQKEAKGSNKKKILFWSLLVSGVGVIIIVALLLIFLLPKEEKYEIELSSNVSVEGEVLTGDGSYKKGDSVTIVAEEITGYRFTGWNFNGKIISTDKEYTFIIGEDTEGEYTANYDKLYSILVEDAHNSVSIVENKTQAIEDEKVEFTIIPNPDYRLISVKVNEDILTENDGKYTFEMPSEDVTIIVTYAEEYAITIDTNSSEYVQIEKQNAIEGENVEFTVSEKVGYRVVEVKYNETTLQSDSNTYTFNMPAEDVTIIVTYAEEYAITTDTNSSEYVQIEKQNAIAGENVEFSVSERVGYRVVEVKYNETTLQSDSNTYSFNMPAEDVTIIVAYAEEYAITIDSSVSDMVTSVSIDKAISGEQVVVAANIQDTVTEDYVIMSDGLYYIENGSEEKVTINQTEGQYSFTMPANDITIGVEKYRRLDDFTFEGNAITGYTGSDTELTLPSYYETVSINSQDYTVEKETGTLITEIGHSAFQSYKYSTSITIPESVTSIDSYAFGNVANRVNIYYQGSLDQWLDIDIAFNDHAPGLLGDLYINNELVEEVTIDENIQYTSFYGIMSLKEVTLGENVTSIGDYAFQNCYSLAIVYNNSSLDITAGNPDNGYVGCYAYEVVNKGGTAQGRTQEINNVNYYINDSTQTKVALYAIDRTASEITLEEDTTAINVGAFYSCTNLTSITIPASVTKLGAGAFSGCHNLNSITIPASVTEIGSQAFYNCSNLTSITIPASVTEIGSSAFWACYSLAIVYNNSSLNITAGSMSSNGDVGYYAYEIVNAGEEAKGRIEKINNINYYINGTTKVALSVIDRKASSVSLEEDTTTINQYAFSGCTNLTSIKIPEGVTEIGQYAFSSCDSLQTVDFGDSSKLQTIGNSVFRGCTNLTSITIPEGVISIREYAFSSCDSLQTVDFGKNSQLQKIGEYAFDGCTNLSMITIPENVTSIIRYAFQNCTSLTSVTIESDDIYNRAIGTDGWSHCGGLLANATTVKVLKTIVDGEGNVNDYLNNESNFTKTTQGADDLYYTYTKINNI